MGVRQINDFYSLLISNDFLLKFNKMPSNHPSSYPNVDLVNRLLGFQLVVLDSQDTVVQFYKKKKIINYIKEHYYCNDLKILL